MKTFEHLTRRFVVGYGSQFDWFGRTYVVVYFTPADGMTQAYCAPKERLPPIGHQVMP
jgi:hypothetical protein